jgi:hypothetical protein
MATQFCGAVTVPTGGWRVTITAGGGGTVGTVPAGTYYINGVVADAADLLTALAGAIQFGLAGEGSAAIVAVTLSSSGIVSISLDTGTATLAWTDTDLRDILRFDPDGASTALSTTATSGHRTARFYASSSFPVQVDIPTTRYRSSTDEADDGTIRGLVLSNEINEYRLQIRYLGGHRNATFTEYHAWQSFFEDVMGQYVLCRWYPDSSVTTPFDDTYKVGTPTELANPNGYHVGRFTDPTEWTPQEFIPGYYGQYTSGRMRFRINAS